MTGPSIVTKAHGSEPKWKDFSDNGPQRLLAPFVGRTTINGSIPLVGVFPEFLKHLLRTFVPGVNKTHALHGT